MKNEIRLKNVTKAFNHKTVVHRLDLQIKQGEIISICGANGSGKSTVLKMIAGMLYQDEGEIEAFGISNQSKKVRELCGYVMESGQGYYGYLSAYENARYFFGLNKIKYKQVEKEFHSLCDAFQFTQHLHKKVDELSQGNRQKFSLIVSMICKPDVLLLDEPTNGLDTKSIQVLGAQLNKLSLEQNKTIIMTTHEEAIIECTNARIIYMEEGSIVTDKSEHDMYHNLMYEIWLPISEKQEFLKSHSHIKFEINSEGTAFLIVVDGSIKKEMIKKYDIVKLNEITKHCENTEGEGLHHAI